MKSVDNNASDSPEQNNIELIAHPARRQQAPATPGEANSPEDQTNIEHEVLRARRQQAPVVDETQPPENAPGVGAVEQNNIEREVVRGRQANDHMQLQWRLLIIEICFTAFGVAVQALQTPNPLLTSFRFRCFRMAMVFSFAALLMSVYICRYSESVALIFEHIGVFFGAMAFLLAVTMD